MAEMDLGCREKATYREMWKTIVKKEMDPKAL